MNCYFKVGGLSSKEPWRWGEILGAGIDGMCVFYVRGPDGHRPSGAFVTLHRPSIHVGQQSMTVDGYQPKRKNGRLSPGYDGLSVAVRFSKPPKEAVKHGDVAGVKGRARRVPARVPKR